MSKRIAEPVGKPTRPRPTDENGFELDEWGVPLSGPRRRAVLAAAGRRDPREHPEDWKADGRAASIKKAKEAILGPDVKGGSNG